MVKKITSKKNQRKSLNKKNDKTSSKSKKSLIIIIVILILLIIACATYFLINDYQIKKEQERRANLLAQVTENYHQYVTTKNQTKLFSLNNETYQEVGLIGANVTIELRETDLTYQTKYFQLADLDYFVAYDEVIPSEAPTINKRYESYIVFNKNIITNDQVSFYDESDQLFMTINQSVELPIIINDTDKYGVEFYNRLLYVKKTDVKEIKKVTNTKEKTRSNIRTLTYHTVYDKKTQKCNNIYVCHPIEQFEEHMKYLHNKKYLTLTMEELEMFLDGKIRVPKKTIVITLDDGRRLYNSVPIVEKYQIHATFFVITSKYSIKKYKDSIYAHFESHTDDLHHNYVCNSGYYGGQLLCEDYDKIIADLKLSQEKLGGSTYFAYPFFDSNARAIKALKETGFKMAFIGEYTSQGYSDAKTDRYQLRRKTVFGNDPLSTLKSYLAESE